MDVKRTLITNVLYVSLFMAYSSMLSAQTCIGSVPETTPSSDFVLNNDGTVTHASTGLMWKVCSEGQTWNAGDGSCAATATTHTWQQALQIPQALNIGGGYAGNTDWRLPNLKELRSILELKCFDPAINETIFKNTQSTYWSSSPYSYISGNAWTVFFSNGVDSPNNRSGAQFVRLVRNK